MQEQYDDYINTHFAHIHRDDYARMARYFHKNYAGLIRSKDDRILDVGCGMGHFLYFLQQAGCTKSIGIDLSPACIDYCLANGYGRRDNLFALDLIAYLRQTPERFDLIVLNDVIEHLPKEAIVPNLAAALQGLAEGGRLVIKVVNSANPITGAASRYVDFTHTVGFTEESLAQVLRMAGFTHIELRAQDIWVFNPLVNLVGRLGQGLLNTLFRLLTLLYGRKTTKIFTKDLIAVASRATAREAQTARSGA
jgi:2-polyprenyl-3-methyl-5-hydroxy-6-metoxy-1,4-benzoquinol methylase